MQYIKKENTQPEDWNSWFSKPDVNKMDSTIRTFDYKKDYSVLTDLSKVRDYLIKEQNNLCAYCQKTITLNNSSIEHVIPKSKNKELSTNYYNLVAVCSNTKHCDKAKEDKLITPLLFMEDCDVTITKNNAYFSVKNDGTIVVKAGLSVELTEQVKAFINTVDLNNISIKEARTKDALNGIISAWQSLDINNKRKFLFTKRTNLINTKETPYRQFLLIWISSKLGIN